MSTTVTYKGSTLTTVDNQTRTLLTSGKYMEDDITLTDVSGGGVWNWIGQDVEKLSNCYSESTTLKAVGFDSWTASTTAGTLRNGQTGTAFTADMANYDYLIKWRCRWDAAYLTGATFTAMPVNGMMEIYQFICRRPSTLANVQSETYDQNVSQLMFNLTYQEYWNTSGLHVMNWGNTYGVTFTNNAPTYGGGDSPTITPTCPSIGARCNNSYFNAARKPYIDSENSPVKIVGEVYRFSKSALLATYESMVTLAKNGL